MSHFNLLNIAAFTLCTLRYADFHPTIRNPQLMNPFFAIFLNHGLTNFNSG